MRTRFAGWPEEDVTNALGVLERTRDRVLERARLGSGHTVVDVGAGTGLLTFGALSQIGDGWVVAVDPSVDCLEERRRLAREAGAAGIAYLVGGAEVLPLPDGLADAVVTRSVLIYVDDTAEAAREFFRVLRPGGRLSTFEPVNRRGSYIADTVDWSPLGPLGERVRREAAEHARHSPLMRFDEHEFTAELAAAGFVEIDVEREDSGEEWSVTDETVELRLDAVGAPGQPSLRERWLAAFSPDDVERLVAHLKSLRGTTLTFRRPQAFVAATRP